jgi:adenylate cyclase class 2
MYLEIEAKLKVDSLEEVECRLTACGAAFVAKKVQIDCYFDTAEGQLTQTDRCLRLRTDRREDGDRLILTFKGPKQADDFKKRQEVNLEVTDAAGLECLLEGLGYRRALAFDKRRCRWDVGDCEVALDELPLLGTFVEIEGPDSAQIAAVQAALGLTDAPHVMDSYASLIAEALAQRNSASREAFL